MGDPLPAGKTVFYQPDAYGRSFIGEGTTPDKAIDEEVDLVFGEADEVTVATETPEGDRLQRDVVIRNANPFPVLFEAEFPYAADVRYRSLPSGLIKKPSKRVWRTTLPANGEAKLTYRIDDRDDE